MLPEEHPRGPYVELRGQTTSDHWSELEKAIKHCPHRTNVDRDAGVQIAVQELHHRIKNELQIIISLIRRNARSEDAQLALSTCVSQIASLASLHDIMLPGRLAGRVELGTLLHSICDEFSNAFGGRSQIAIEVELDSIEVSTASAESIALIVNEALTNAVKHGSSGCGEIRVTLKLQEGRKSAILAISNDYLTAISLRPPGFGTRLMGVLVDKLGGHISRIVTDDDYVVEYTFPLD